MVRGKFMEFVPFHLAAAILTVGDGEDDTSSGLCGERFCKDCQSRPELEGLGTAGACLAFTVEDWSMDGRIESLRDVLAVGGGEVVEGANEGAVNGVDGNVIVGTERLGGEGEDRIAEGGLEWIGVAAGVEEDGEIDGVVGLEPRMGRVKARSGIETDLELIGGDGWEWLEKGA